MPPNRLITFAFVLLAAGGRVLAQGGSWTDIADMPTPRRLHAAATEGGNLYVFGGCGSPCFGPPFHNSADEETKVEVYFPQQKRWAEKKRMPTILFGGAAAAPGNRKIYTFGGYVSGNVVQEYDPTEDSWKIKSPMPTPRYGLAAVVYRKEIYVLGGSGPSGAVEIYDPTNDTWRRGAPMPTPRVFLAAALLDGRIHAIGGSPDCCGGSQTDVVEIYDPTRDRWETGPRLPSARQVSAAATVNRSIVLFGGFIPGSGVQADILVLDPRNPDWTFGTPMPVGRDQASSAVLGSDVYVPGGSIDCHCRALARTDRFEPQLPDLTCTIQGPATVPAGGQATYSVTLANRGEAAATGVELGDLTPEGLSLAGTGPPCGGRLPCLLGTMDPGDSRKIRVTFQVPAGCAVPAPFRPEAAVRGDEPELVTANNTCKPERFTRILPPQGPGCGSRCPHPFQNPGDPPADLPPGVWGIIEGPTEAAEGSTIEYRILLANGGPDPQPDGDGPELDHPIPFGLQWLESEADSGRLQIHEPAVSGDPDTALFWDGGIPVCGTVTIQVRARILGEAGSEICLQGTLGAGRRTGLRGRIEHGEPFCIEISPQPPA